jgi:hypothetical protein
VSRHWPERVSRLTTSWALNTSNIYLKEKQIKAYASNISGYGLVLDSWFWTCSSTPMPIATITTKDCQDVVRPRRIYNMGDCPNPPVGYILGPLTDLPLAILHIQDLITAPIPLIHINADSNLLAAVKEVGIPIEVSLYLGHPRYMPRNDFMRLYPRRQCRLRSSWRYGRDLAASDPNQPSLCSSA